jgi:hypothetical protein
MDGVQTKMNSTLTATIVVLLSITSLVPTPARSIACPPEARLLEVGQFHKEEVEAETGEQWLGLHISEDSSMLLNYELTVESVEDPVVDEPGQKTGKKVAVDLPLQPIFLINSDWILNAGPVETVFEGNPERLERIAPVKLHLAGTSYQLKIAGPEDGEKCWQDGLPKNAKLVLATGNSSQVLYTLEECGSDPTWALLWAGDLDKDGKLDLYVSVTQHYNISEKKLFLSSQADEGQLVQEIAEFVTSGC